MKKTANFKILMIIPKQKATKDKDYSYIFPLGIGYISSVLKSAGYSVDCLNMNHRTGSIEEILIKQLDKEKYDFVGTGSITTDYQVMKKIIDSVHNHRTKPKVILGGLIITSEPETIFKLLNPDYAVIGEGEETILELLDCIENKKDLKKVKGIEFKDSKGNLIKTEAREPSNDLDKIPYPDYEGFEFEQFLNNLHPNSHDYIYSAFDHPRVYSIMGSRGCPFNCTFCYHYNRYRKRSLDSIMKELEVMVRKYKANIILFYDECIAADKKRLAELCARMTKFRKEIPWEIKWYPQLTVHNINEETLKMMKDSGVAGVSYGFESFSSKVLKSMNKPITPEMIESAFKKTMKAGLTMQANFIFGDTAETMETAMETLNWWKKNAYGQIHLLFIQPYAGSKIYHEALRRGIIRDKEEFISNVVPFSKFNLTENMTDREMEKLRKEILKSTAKYSKFVVPKIRKRGKNIYDLEMRCPYCKSKFKYGNCYIENRFLFGHILPCRKCGMLFYIVSSLEKIGYKNYTFFRSLRDIQKKILRRIDALKLKI